MTTPNDPLTTIVSAVDRYAIMQQVARDLGASLSDEPSTDEAPQANTDTQ